MSTAINDTPLGACVDCGRPSGDAACDHRNENLVLRVLAGEFSDGRCGFCRCRAAEDPHAATCAGLVGLPEEADPELIEYLNSTLTPEQRRSSMRMVKS